MNNKNENTVSNLLAGARVYLSGPMDFVASREDEMKHGWRRRIGAFLRDRGCVVFDPWEKPGVRGLADYGREGVDTTEVRKKWTFKDTWAGGKIRYQLAGKFWETLHIDLRMVDTSDFVVAYCPTNIYSVGTPHEIALCRQQRKPVLLVSPPVEFPAFDELRRRLERRDKKGAKILADLENQVPIKPNPPGIPSLWYMALVGGDNFFDGFGFDIFRDKYQWADDGPLDRREKKHQPDRPLLPYLDRLTQVLPRKWNPKRKDGVRNDDWLLWDLQQAGGGAGVSGPHTKDVSAAAAKKTK
ncbi:MAG TPA: hypothetical protein VMC06_14810 [Opitutaceae bacterium]|nr:hypothetical protein [Opitutaceae bacterium]